MEEVMIPK